MVAGGEVSRVAEGGLVFFLLPTVLEPHRHSSDHVRHGCMQKARGQYSASTLVSG